MHTLDNSKLSSSQSHMFFFQIGVVHFLPGNVHVNCFNL